MMHRLIGFIAASTLLLFAIPSAAQPSAPYRIIFSSDRDTGDNWQLYTMNADGENVQRLLESDGNDFGARLAPNGRRIAFTRRDEFGQSQIFLLDIIQDVAEPLIEGTSPSWSPDGTTIAYTSFIEGNAEIYTVGTDGLFPQPFTSNAGRDHTPAWSPDGELLAFKSERDEGPGIYVANADRTGVRRITDADDNTHPIRWSPDGTEILFTRKIDGRSAVHVVKVETGETRQLIDMNAATLLPVWAPEGDQVVFVAIIDNQPDIYRVDVDGSNLTRLTEHPGWDWHPTIFAP